MKNKARPFCTPIISASSFDMSINDRTAHHMKVLDWAKKDMGRCMIIPKEALP